MAVEKKFIAKALDDLDIKRFLERELKRASVSSATIQKTPIATRITICVRRPSMVVGRRGKSINELADKLRNKFGIENPQIEVVEVMKPALDARLMAEKIARQIEMRPRVKPILRFALKDIMEAGAIGAEIRAAGKIVGKGGKAREFVVRKGYIKKSGDPVKLVRKGTYTAFLKAGAVGITVRIVPPGTVFPDQVKIEVAAPKKEETTLKGVVEGEVPAKEPGTKAEAPKPAEEEPEQPKEGELNKARVTKPEQEETLSKLTEAASEQEADASKPKEEAVKEGEGGE